MNFLHQKYLPVFVQKYHFRLKHQHQPKPNQMLTLSASTPVMVSVAAWFGADTPGVSLPPLISVCVAVCLSIQHLSGSPQCKPPLYCKTGLPLWPFETRWPLTLSLYVCVHTRYTTRLPPIKYVLQSQDAAAAVLKNRAIESRDKWRMSDLLLVWF